MMKSAFEIRCFLPLFFTILSIAVRVKSLRYLSGDFLSEPLALSPQGELYPRSEIEKLIDDLPKQRNGRSMQFLTDPWTTRRTLLEWQNSGRLGPQRNFKEGREITQSIPEVSNTFVLPPDIDATIVTGSTLVENGTTFISTTPTPTVPSQTTMPTVSSCESSSNTPQRLCKTKFNTTAPMYGVSLTSGNPVTIVQKFPDLLQQVIFEVCASDTCDVVHGECIQTYVPYLFLVIPLGPVTLTGQDYVLVESGCVCRPRYAGPQPPPNPLDEINFGLGV